MTIQELIEKLQQFDPDLTVATDDCCYGISEPADPILQTVEGTWHDLDLPVGANYVLIG